MRALVSSLIQLAKYLWLESVVVFLPSNLTAEGLSWFRDTDPDQQTLGSRGLQVRQNRSHQLPNTVTAQ